MGLPGAHKIQEGLYNRADGGILKLTDIHRHWLYVKPPQTAVRRAEEQKQEDYTIDGDEGDDADIEVRGTPPPDVPPSPPLQVLQIQEPAVVKAKGRPRGASDRLWAGAAPPRPTASQQRRQQTFENSIQRTPSAFELTSDLPSSQVPDSQPPPPSQGQRGGRGGRQRGARGRAAGRATGGQTGGVPASYMGASQM